MLWERLNPNCTAEGKLIHFFNYKLNNEGWLPSVSYYNSELFQKQNKTQIHVHI